MLGLYDTKNGGLQEVLSSINKTAAMPDTVCPNQTGGAEKMLAAHQGLLYQEIERTGRKT